MASHAIVIGMTDKKGTCLRAHNANASIQQKVENDYISALQRHILS